MLRYQKYYYLTSSVQNTFDYKIVINLWHFFSFGKFISTENMCVSQCCTLSKNVYKTETSNELQDKEDCLRKIFGQEENHRKYKYQWNKSAIFFVKKLNMAPIKQL